MNTTVKFNSDHSTFVDHFESDFSKESVIDEVKFNTSNSFRMNSFKNLKKSPHYLSNKKKIEDPEVFDKFVQIF